MYAHQVVDDVAIQIQAFLKSKLSISELKELGEVYNTLKSATCFHLGEWGVEDQKFSAFSKEQLLHQSLALPVKFAPYPATWFDFDVKGQDPIKKNGVLLIDKGEGEYRLFFFYKINNSQQKRWFIFPSASIWWPEGKSIHKSELMSDVHAFTGHKIHFDEAGYATSRSSGFNFLGSFFPEETLHGAVALSIFSSFVVNASLIFLNCRNISTIDHEPPTKLNKSRKKKGKCPIFTYKTLVIKPTSKKQKEQEAQGLWENRIHLCRGHFKEYTEDKPLFGKLTGRYWWQPSVRGRNRNGVVMKDYKVEV